LAVMVKTGKIYYQVKDEKMTDDQNELRCENCIFEPDGGRSTCEDCIDYCYWISDPCERCAHGKVSPQCIVCQFGV